MTDITRKDIIKYITAIRLNFENAYKTQNDDEMEILINTWYSILSEYPKELCDRAVIDAIKHAEFPPRIGAIVKEIERMMKAFVKSETELWGDLEGILRDVRDCVYRFDFTGPYSFKDPKGPSQGDVARMRVKKLFDDLDPAIKEYCRDVRGLIKISDLSSDQLGYEKNRFLKTIPDLRERMKTRNRLSPAVASLVQGMAERLALPGGGDGT